MARWKKWKKKSLSKQQAATFENVVIKNEHTPLVENGNKKAKNDLKRKHSSIIIGADTFKSFLYSPPKQRHNWGDEQELPHVRWVDLFYDLFFVGLAYNLGHVILEAWASPISVFYFMGLFLPCSNPWYSKMYFESRFIIGDDMFHKMLMVVETLLLATAVLHIEPEVEIMRNTKENFSLLVIALAILGSIVIGMIRKAEIYFDKNASLNAKIWSINDIKITLPSFCIYLVICYICFSDYRSGHSEVFHHEGNSESFHEERKLHEEHEAEYSNDIPICLFYCSSLGFQLLKAIFVFFVPEEEVREVSVPVNVEFVSHRCGEWIMLMLGESILSLLIVRTQSTFPYYFTLYVGVLTVVFMQYHHFQSEARYIEEHAFNRGKMNSIFFQYLNQYYSAAVLSIGFSYKMMLTFYTDHGVSELGDVQAEKIGSHITIFFCSALVIAFITLDTIMWLNKRLTWKASVKRITCFVIRILVIIIILSVAGGLGNVRDPVILTLIGFIAVLTKVLCQIVVHVNINFTGGNRDVSKEFADRVLYGGEYI